MEQQHESLIDDAINVIAELGIEALNLAENKLHFKRQELRAQTEGCNGVPMPTQPPAGHTLGHYYCTKDGWQWEDEIG